MAMKYAVSVWCLALCLQAALRYSSVMMILESEWLEKYVSKHIGLDFATIYQRFDFLLCVVASEEKAFE